MKIDFDAEKHEYSVDGEKIPSVSEILNPLNAERYGLLNAMVLQEAARRGTAVHEATEQIDYELEPDEDPEIEGYVNAYYQFLFDHDADWLMIEQIVPYYRCEGEPPIYAGTVDRFGWVDDELAVVDIKTYASMSTEAQLTASCQTALYRDAIMWGKDSWADDYTKPIKRYVLHLKKDGKYRLIDLDNFDEKRGWNGPAMAWELYNFYAAKRDALAGKRKKNGLR